MTAKPIIDYNIEKTFFPMRMLAVQCLYASDLGKEKDITVHMANLSEYFKFSHDEKNFCSDIFQLLVLTAHKNLDAIDEIISKHLNQAWKIERLPKLILALLRISVGEIIFLNNTHHSILISDFLTITNLLSFSSETPFVNGILDSIKKNLK